jgi:hypothetical protein
MSSGKLNKTNLSPGTYNHIFSNKATADLSTAQEVITKVDLTFTN